MAEILNIGTSGLNAAQRSLDTIANNIANASTPGYSRQVTHLSTQPDIQLGKNFYGSGVKVENAKRVVDDFIVGLLRENQADLNEMQAITDILENFDNLILDPAMNISEGMNQYFNALQEVSNDPSSITLRQIFLTKGQLLEDRIQQLNTQINKAYQNTNQQINEGITQINQLVKQIAVANQQIITLTNDTMGNPNALLDLRENLLLDLSQYVGIETITQHNGSIDIFIGKGQSLLVGTQYQQLMVKTNTSNPTQLEILIVGDSYSQDISNTIEGGIVGGIRTVREEVLPQINNLLGRLAISLALTMNKTNAKGIDLNGEFGGNIFNDPNELNAQLSRAISNADNKGNAAFTVKINEMQAQANRVDSSGSSLVDASSLPILTNGILSLNNVMIRSTTLSDDSYSTSDALASAIAIANAINSQSHSHGVTANPDVNVLNLGSFSNGALAAGNLKINGIDIISTGSDNITLINAINSCVSRTGVTGTILQGNIVLTAEDGRNIHLTTNGAANTATFSFFDMTSGIGLNKVQKSGITLISNSDAITIGGANPGAVGFERSTTMSPMNELTAIDYELSFDGTYYSLSQIPTQNLVMKSSTPTFSIDGFTLSLYKGTMSAGDKFIIQPTANGAKQFKLTMASPSQLAMAYPIEVTTSLSNEGNAQIKVSEICSVSGDNVSPNQLGNAFLQAGKLTPPIKIEFISSDTYRVYDMTDGIGKQLGPDQHYDHHLTPHSVFPMPSVINYSLPGPTTPYTYDPGYRLEINGTPAVGDIFLIDFNQHALGDNRNGNQLVNLQYDKIMLNGTATYQEMFAELVNDISSQTAQSQINLNANLSLFNSINSRKNSISGVNLDEEAANLLKFEQAYQACAQVIVIARSVFDTLIDALGR